MRVCGGNKPVSCGLVHVTGSAVLLSYRHASLQTMESWCAARPISSFQLQWSFSHGSDAMILSDGDDHDLLSSSPTTVPDYNLSCRGVILLHGESAMVAHHNHITHCTRSRATHSTPRLSQRHYKPSQGVRGLPQYMSYKHNQVHCIHANPGL